MDMILGMIDMIVFYGSVTAYMPARDPKRSCVKISRELSLPAYPVM
jgi:hypothetical protein